MLVSENGAHRGPARSPLPSIPEEVIRPNSLARRAHLREVGEGDVEGGGQLLRPSLVADVEEHGARGVGDIGGVGPSGGTSGQVPQDPRVHRGESQPLRGRNSALVEEPPHLGGGEIGITDEPGSLPDERPQAPGLERTAGFEGAAVLPDDGPVQGGSASSVPGDHGLALVGDAHGDGFPPGLRQPGGHLADGGPDEGPDLGGIVLDPARAREVLGELAVCGVDHPGSVVHHQGPHAGGAGVDGEHDGGAGHGFGTLGSRRTARRARSRPPNPACLFFSGSRIRQDVLTIWASIELKYRKADAQTVVLDVSAGPPAPAGTRSDTGPISTARMSTICSRPAFIRNFSRTAFDQGIRHRPVGHGQPFMVDRGVTTLL